MRFRPVLLGLAGVMSAAGFGAGWFGSAALIAPPVEVALADPEPSFTDVGIFYVNFGPQRQLAAMRAGLVVDPKAAPDLSFAEMRDATLDVLVGLADKPVTTLDTRPGPALIRFDSDTQKPGTLNPDLATLERLASFTAPEWMLRMKLVSASSPPLAEAVETPESAAEAPQE